jgi:hypothetical protein
MLYARVARFNVIYTIAHFKKTFRELTPHPHTHKSGVEFLRCRSSEAQGLRRMNQGYAWRHWITHTETVLTMEASPTLLEAHYFVYPDRLCLCTPTVSCLFLLWGELDHHLAIEILLLDATLCIYSLCT